MNGLRTCVVTLLFDERYVDSEARCSNRCRSLLLGGSAQKSVGKLKSGFV
jgi:hypothetical protein